MVTNGSGYQTAKRDDNHRRALRITKGTASFCDRFVPDHDELMQLVSVLRAMDCTIVFTMGAWDLIHIGHAEYILRGKEEATKLYPNAEHIIMIVGVDSNELVAQIKGPDRPIVDQKERLRMLSHFRTVDILTLQYNFDELPGIIEHDVRIISESTKGLSPIEEIQRHCAHVVNLPPQAETSTTARVRRLTIDGADKVILKIEKSLKELLKEVRSEIEK